MGEQERAEGDADEAAEQEGPNPGKIEAGADAADTEELAQEGAGDGEGAELVGGDDPGPDADGDEGETEAGEALDESAQGRAGEDDGERVQGFILPTRSRSGSGRRC